MGQPAREPGSAPGLGSLQQVLQWLLREEFEAASRRLRAGRFDEAVQECRAGTASATSFAELADAINALLPTDGPVKNLFNAAVRVMCSRSRPERQSPGPGTGDLNRQASLVQTPMAHACDWVPLHWNSTTGVPSWPWPPGTSMQIPVSRNRSRDSIFVNAGS